MVRRRPRAKTSNSSSSSSSLLDQLEALEKDVELLYGGGSGEEKREYDTNILDETKDSVEHGDDTAFDTVVSSKAITNSVASSLSVPQSIRPRKRPRPDSLLGLEGIEAMSKGSEDATRQRELKMEIAQLHADAKRQSDAWKKRFADMEQKLSRADASVEQAQTDAMRVREACRRQEAEWLKEKHRYRERCRAAEKLAEEEEVKRIAMVDEMATESRGLRRSLKQAVTERDEAQATVKRQQDQITELQQRVELFDGKNSINSIDSAHAEELENLRRQLAMLRAKSERDEDEALMAASGGGLTLPDALERLKKADRQRRAVLRELQRTKEDLRKAAERVEREKEIHEKMKRLQERVADRERLVAENEVLQEERRRWAEEFNHLIDQDNSQSLDGISFSYSSTLLLLFLKKIKLNTSFG